MNELELQETVIQFAPKTDQQTEELSKTVKTYRALIAASNTGAWEFFVDRSFFNCNDIYFSLLGRDINNFDHSGKANFHQVWTDLLHPDDREAAMEHFNNYLQNPGCKAYEAYFRMQHADGSWVWIWSRGGYMQDEFGNNANRVTGTHTDVTITKKAEEEIQRERILLRTLIDNLPDTIYVKDAEGRKIIANRADVAAIGANSEAEVIGKTDLELFENNIGLRGYQDDMEVLQAGKPILNKEEFFFDKNGLKHWLVTSKVPVRDEEGKISRILGIGHNITERKKSEEALNRLNQELNLQSRELSKQAADLKVLNAQLTQQKEYEMEKAIAQGKFEIASEVLHDIGNALVGFGSYLNRINRVQDKNNVDTSKSLALFLKGQQSAIGGAIGADKANALVSITEGIAKTQIENKEEIGTSVSGLINIVTHIQEILNIQRQFVRGHGGKHERKAVNLASIIDDCKAMLFASFDKKGIQLSTAIQPGNHIIKGDHTKLMQVILNVLKNSVEAIDFDSADKKISIALASDTGGIELRITDNGQGFDAETGSRFFERGFSTKKSGTGLGLYNCRSIVESHGGKFLITSNGKGLGAVTVIRFAAEL
jgi:PAS domain S-box-containing protein